MINKDSNIWQLCPKCGGSGMAMNHSLAIPFYTDTCDVCKGEKIISKLTGRPPRNGKPKITKL